MAVAAHALVHEHRSITVSLTTRPQALKRVVETPGPDSPIKVPSEILWNVNAAIGHQRRGHRVGWRVS